MAIHYLCSHYKVFAVPVRKEIDPITSGHHFVPVVPSSKLLTQSVQPQSISKDSDPAPLLVGTYALKLLPRTIVFNGQDMRISFVPNTHYSFVTAVFTQSMVCAKNLFFCAHLTFSFYPD